MKSLIIYDSYFGNTEKVAQLIGKGLKESKVVRIDDLEEMNLKDVDVLVIGSPTRAFKPTEKITKFLKNLKGNTLEGVKVATFDTRINVKEVNNAFLSFMVNIFGYATEPIAKRLVKVGAELIIDPEGFVVVDSEGPLAEGEEKRAEEWGEKIQLRVEN